MRQSLENEEIIIIISTPNFLSQSFLISKDCFAVQKWFPESATYECLRWLIAPIYLHVMSNIKLWIMHNSVSTAEKWWGCIDTHTQTHKDAPPHHNSQWIPVQMSTYPVLNMQAHPQPKIDPVLLCAEFSWTEMKNTTNADTISQI